MPDPRPITPGLFRDDGARPRLLTGRCPGCSRRHFPSAPVCPYCGADGCVETPAGPHGRLRLYTAVLSAPPGYRGPVPYGFGVVELDDGLRVITRLTEARLDRLRPGLSVRLVLEPLFTDDEGRAVISYAFAPAE
ncbi:MAG TPA: OB-fold domain-containing protein [Candidatus Binatia bacterium]|nr:OB-fold domain-containing protein [Candidatus Binatia bacterium]